MRSTSYDEDTAKMLEPFAQKLGLDIVTFDVETL